MSRSPPYKQVVVVLSAIADLLGPFVLAAATLIAAARRPEYSHAEQTGLSKTYEMVSRAKTETLHRILTRYLPLYFSEVEPFGHYSRGGWPLPS